MGELGLKPHEFEELDFVEMELMSDGFFKRQEFELLNTRKIMWAVFQSQSKKNINESDMIRLSIDEESFYKKEDLMTKDEIEAVKKRIKWHKKK